MNNCIEEYIARLPVSYRSVVILSEHEGLTNQEIADALGVSLETVKIRLHPARPGCGRSWAAAAASTSWVKSAGIAALVLGVVAVILIITSATGFCPGYVPLGISTRKEPSRAARV